MGSIFDYERFREQQRSAEVRRRRRARKEAKDRATREARHERQHRVREERKKRREAKAREERRRAKWEAIQAKIDADIARLKEDAKKERDEAGRDAVQQRLRELEEQRQTQLADAAEFQAAERARLGEADAEERMKTRGRARGLSFWNPDAMHRDIAAAMEAFDVAVEATEALVQPDLPTFLDGEHSGIWKTPALYHFNFLLSRWTPGPGEVEADIDGSYDLNLPNWFDLWLAWEIPVIDNILWEAKLLANNIRELVGERGVDRLEWQPGIVDDGELSEAIGRVYPEASVAWNEALAGIETPPSIGQLEDYAESQVRYQGVNYPVSLRRPGGESGFSGLVAGWADWLDNISQSYETLSGLKGKLRSSRPGLEAVFYVFRPFSKGTQYHFRGL